ncbi:hypothetical protein CMU89_16985 [Elizabethkingia anophelis]|nr:hypothetical protein [Elizabethkingia anophelis]MDV3544336.1 hypothetical protein [Elizabethkingia anophelis]
MKFKGTKGTEQEQRNYGFKILYPDWDSDDVVGFTEQQEEKAFLVGYKQALKDSKAPELIEMLKVARDKFLDLKHDKDLHELQEIQDEIETLIKQATE